MTSRKKKELEKLQEQGTKLMEKLAECTIGFKNLFNELGKSAMQRVSYAILEHPIPPEKKLVNSSELEAYQLGLSMRAVQTDILIINRAMSEVRESIRKSEEKKAKKEQENGEV